jgi:hypothetical protein
MIVLQGIFKVSVARENPLWIQIGQGDTGISRPKSYHR